jgi:pilus assembly protein CpaE
MSGAIRTLVAVDNLIDPRLVEAVLDDPGIKVMGVVDQESGLQGLDTTPADVLLVACGAASAEALDFIDGAARAAGQRPIVVVCGGSPNGFVGAVLGSGADDIVLLDETSSPGSDTFFAIQKALARRSLTGGHVTATGHLVCVLGPKGGIGKTLTACNLGVALADAGHRTAIVDLDLQFGDLGLALSLQPERTIYDLASSGGTLDAEKVQGYLTEHESGAQILLAPIRPDQAATITSDFLRTLYPALTAAFDYVIVDTPPGFSPEVITTIDASSSICMVGMLDAPSLKNTKLGLETLGLMRYPADQIRLLLNRADTNVGISHADVLAVLGRAPDVLIPSQRDIVRSINAGQPIVTSSRRSEPAKGFRALADIYVAAAAPATGSADSGSTRRSLLRKR